MSKPRQRLRQKQTSRLYLRRKDHRDCIMNDTYHNAIWFKRLEDEVQKDELVWCKYPQNALMNLGNGSTLGWLDTDRQFNYCISYSGGSWSPRIFRLDDVCVAFNSYSSTDAYWTEDGIVWHKFPNKPSWYAGIDVFEFGTNMLISRGFYTSNWQLTKFSKDAETGEWKLTNTNLVVPYNSEIICRTEDGCIARTETIDRNTLRYTITFWHITPYGYTQKGEIRNVPWHIETRCSRDCSRRDYQGFVVGTSYRRYWSDNIYSDTFNNQILAIVSMDNFQTYQVQVLYEHDSNYSQSWINWGFRFDAFVRDGYMYCLFCDLGQNGHLFRTLTQQWNEVELPSWVDLPCLQSGGQGVQRTTKEFVRLAIKPSETQNADTNIFNALGEVINNTTRLNGNSFNIKFKDGKVQNWGEEDEYLALRGYSSYVLVFDNLRFISSSKSFAFIPSSYNSSVDGRDTVQPNDYVIRP